MLTVGYYLYESASKLPAMVQWILLNSDDHFIKYWVRNDGQNICCHSALHSALLPRFVQLTCIAVSTSRNTGPLTQIAGNIRYTSVHWPNCIAHIPPGDNFYVTANF